VAQPLERDVAVDAEVAREHHLAHAALAELLADAVAGRGQLDIHVAAIALRIARGLGGAPKVGVARHLDSVRQLRERAGSHVRARARASAGEILDRRRAVAGSALECWRRSEGGPVPSYSIKKPTILAVDDTPGNLLALEAVLERDFELVFADSAPKAIEILKRRSDIAVVLMDIQMPGMDGFEGATRIKALPGCSDLPIVFVTAVYNEDPYIKRGYAMGGVDYFTKPFDPDLLRLKMAIYASFRQKAALLDEREQRVRETEELLVAGRKLAAFLESLPVGVLIADRSGAICQTNDEVSRIFRAGQATDRDDYGTVLDWWASDGATLKDPDGPLARALGTGVSSHNQVVQIRCFDGSEKTIVMSASPLLGVAGEIVGAVIVLKDTSESKTIEAEFESRVTRLVSLGVELEHSMQAAERKH
jgi:CheY-like chemotaxis protein